MLLSIAINVLLGGRVEPLCARVHRRGWRRLERIIDRVFDVYRGGTDPAHCRRMFEGRPWNGGQKWLR